MMAWTQKEAIALCTQIEAVCPRFGCHVALTGGTLYKKGRRKDADILFYRIRQTPEIDYNGLFLALSKECNVEVLRDHGWCVKAALVDVKQGKIANKGIDLFFPERPGQQEYQSLASAEREHGL